MKVKSSHIDVPNGPTKRRGARRRSEIAEETLLRLNLGLDETVNLMEWLAVDMDMLCQSVLSGSAFGNLGPRILEQVPRLHGLGVTKRLAAVGSAIASVAPDPDDPVHSLLSQHGSDIVRQWAVYALHGTPGICLEQRLARTKRFAADHNMTVRECAWIAFRPHLAVKLDEGIRRLHAWVEDADPNVRRFAIEVTRPRSVWGSHLTLLKREPSRCLSLLEPVQADPSAYVRTALANWLNDASKTRPDWVVAVCERWSSNRDRRTDWIIGRALRTYRSATYGHVLL